MSTHKFCISIQANGLFFFLTNSLEICWRPKIFLTMALIMYMKELTVEKSSIASDKWEQIGFLGQTGPVYV